jgi:hypothetical protein
MANIAEELFRRIDALEKTVAELQIAQSDTSLDFLTKSEPKAEAKANGALAKLVKAFEAHYADYDGSKLAKLARELYGNAKAKSIALAWAHTAKEPSVTKWAKSRNNSAIQAWYKGQVA